MEVLTTIDEARIREELGADRFFWLDLVAPADADIALLGDLLGLHPVAMEDTREFGQRPKVDVYHDNVLAVFYTVRVRGGQVEPIEVHVYVAANYIVTVRASECAVLDDLHAELEPVDAKEEELLVYRIFDGLTDAYYPAIESLEERIDALEAEVIERARPHQRGDIYRLRQDVREIHRTVSTQRDQFESLETAIGGMAGLSKGSRAYLRDVADHLAQVAGELHRQLEDLGALTATYFSANSDRLNQVATRLTVLGTFFLVWTLVTGFFGQNFNWLVDHVDGLTHFLIFGVGALVLPTVILALVFYRKRRDWF